MILHCHFAMWSGTKVLLVQFITTSPLNVLFKTLEIAQNRFEESFSCAVKNLFRIKTNAVISS